MKRLLPYLLFVALGFTLNACKTSSSDRSHKNEPIAERIHVVTDLAHEFSFYADNRFHRQYLPNQRWATNWCNLWNFDFSNANLLVLLACDDRIEYLDKDIEVINTFLKEGGGVVIAGDIDRRSQNKLLKEFGAEFTTKATYPLNALGDFATLEIEGNNAAVLSLDKPSAWSPVIVDADNKPVMATRKVGKGTLLVSARSLAGSNPNARDSINTGIWQPLLKKVAAGKTVDKNKPFRSSGIDKLEYNDNHGTFILSYNDYLKPFAASMVDIYTRSLPYIENRMGVPLSPGMGSQITLLATGGGGFSSGTVVALAVWWGGFPDREDSMIEFLTHEAVHSWVLPFPEIWNEPIATYIGNLVMIDMGHEEEALKRIASTIRRAERFDPTWKNYDLDGNLTGTGEELTDGQKNEIHWGKSYWLFEELRKEKPDFWAEYFKIKRANTDKIKKYDIHNTVAVLSKAMGRDLFDWFNEHGMPCDKTRVTL
jgi:hypothetical protein